MTVDAEQAALQQLELMRSSALQGVALDGRWVAQLASKSVGTTDPLQEAANGTHTFYAADIVAEASSLSSRVGAPLLVLQSTDFGKRSVSASGQPYWVVLHDGAFADAASVQAWCDATFADLGTAQRSDACAARTMSPSH